MLTNWALADAVAPRNHPIAFASIVCLNTWPYSVLVAIVLQNMLAVTSQQRMFHHFCRASLPRLKIFMDHKDTIFLRLGVKDFSFWLKTNRNLDKRNVDGLGSWDPGICSCTLSGVIGSHWRICCSSNDKTMRKTQQQTKAKVMVKVRDLIFGVQMLMDILIFVKWSLELNACNSICRTMNCFPNSRRNAITWQNEFRSGKISLAKVLLGMYSVCLVSNREGEWYIHNQKRDLAEKKKAL